MPSKKNCTSVRLSDNQKEVIEDLMKGFNCSKSEVFLIAIGSLMRDIYNKIDEGEWIKYAYNKWING